MEKLVKGFLKFRTEVFGKKKALFTRLSENQAPGALHYLFGFRSTPPSSHKLIPGSSLFSKRRAIMVPRYGSMQGGSTATIEYAMVDPKGSPHYRLWPYRLRRHESAAS